MKIKKVSPFLAERVWGGKKAKERGFKTTSDIIGEVWTISAHPNGMGFVSENNKEISLKEYFENNRVLFNNYQGEYPLLNKLLFPEDNLSVQVHPSDEYALKHHGCLGKPESWYVLEAEKNASLIYGHKAKSLDEFKENIKNNDWNKILKTVNIEVNDFINVPAGKIHGVGPGVVIYETQRSSDITYRLYDYNRLGTDGKPRELHIEDSLKNILIPDTNLPIIKNANKNFFQSSNFNLYLWDWSDGLSLKIDNAQWLQVTILSKRAIINNIEFSLYESAIIFDSDIFNLTCDKNTRAIISYLQSK
ncbi:type I phosphomannose isomerase catalytic subunit [Spiroplasma endosymbiont of Aspidapion aeneum]|uniref:type I phosphomannose isomerase catalytic subunit n=1 Tax=Spiroplasma endosymbiont of Aspidapion aeneum TaxID=3066276 RepID=UPI00313C73F9